jgi:ferric-dicitrate binding protein FerR (iron transport regulator)
MKKIDWDILVSHLTGTSSESEEKRLSEWISEKEENRVLFQRLEKLWSSQPKAGHWPDTERALNLVMSKIQRSDSAGHAKIIPLPQAGGIRRALSFASTPSFLRAAAAIVFAAGALYLFGILTSNREPDRTSVVFSAMQSLELPDGTKVTVDVGSTFAYPKRFGASDGREVFLKGEAYFEVSRDEKRPFVIHADGGRIEVLGTKFNVRAWDSDQHIIVAVKEGKVSFQAENNHNSKDVVFLSENNMSKLVRGASPTPPENIDISAILSWMKKEIYFQNVPVPEVLHQLERWYGVTIESSDSTLLKSNITVFVENKPLVENLKLISVTMNVRYEQHGNTIRFLPN